MTSSSVQLLEAGGLRVRFTFRHDRYAHEISLADGSQWVPILASVEGSPEDEWPPSPPLQSLHLESRPGNCPLALLVGMAGRSHWSMSVELDPAAARITFDVACRTTAGAHGRLGSGYMVLEPLADQNPRRAICIPAATAPVGLGLEICKSLRETHLEAKGDLMHLIVASPAGDKSQTIRWGYDVTREIASCPT